MEDKHIKKHNKSIHKPIAAERWTFFRPMFFIAIYLSFGILIGYYLGQNNTAVLILGSACFLFALFDVIKNKRIPYLILYLLSFAAGVMLISEQTHLDAIPMQELNITGRVVDIDHYEYSTYYVLDDWKASEQGIDISPRKKLSVSSKDSSALIGDIISFRSKIDYPKKATNLHGFNQWLYLLNRGVSYKAKTKETLSISQNKIKIDSYFYHARSYVEKTIDTLYGKETAGIAKGLFLGEKEDISEEMYDKYKRGGTASVLAVSGLHFGIISLFLFGVLSFLGVGRKLTFILTGVLIFLYAGLVGFSVSAVRALIITWVIIIANLLGRKQDNLSILSVAYVLSLIINPLSLLSVGFKLSFGAVFAILALLDPIKKRLKWMPEKTQNLAASSVAASLGTAPILINSFNFISLIGVFANIIIIPIASGAVVSVMLSVVFGKTMGMVFAHIGETLILLIDDIMNVILKIPYAAISLKALPVMFIVLWFVIIFIISKFCLLKKLAKRIVSIVLIIVMVVMMVILPIPKFSGLYVYFFDVGQGDATFIKSPSGKCYMIDTGRQSKYAEIERFLSYNGYALDGLILTHSDEDHMGGYLDLVDNGFVKTLYVPVPDRKNYSTADGVDIIGLKKGMTLVLDEKTKMEVLHPENLIETEDTNLMSLCLMLDYSGYKLLFTGDIDEDIESELIPDLSDVDVLKVSHHGSKYGSTPLFLEAIDAEYAVIMCGENYYGHPSNNTIYNLKNYCDIIYRTDLDGGVSFYFDDEIKIETVLKRND